MVFGDSAKKLARFMAIIVFLGGSTAAGIYGWQQFHDQPASFPDNNDYENPPAYPQSTEEFVLLTRELYSDPMNGIGLRYKAKVDPRWQVDINIYPVGALSWVNNPNLLDDEANVILADMDYLISQGQWQRRLDVIREPVNLLGQQGLRVDFKLQQDNTMLHKIVYLYVQQDKYIKFTQNSADITANALVKAQAAVENLLPFIQAPPESPYANKVRQMHMEKMKKKVQELLQAK